MPRMNTMIFTKLLASSQRVAGEERSLLLGSLRHAAGLFVLLLWGMLGGKAGAQSTPSMTFYVQKPNYQTQTRYMQGEVRDSIYFVFGEKGTTPTFTLKAKPSTALNGTFKLSRFRTDGFTKEFQEKQTVTGSEATFAVQEPGGYLVEFTSGSVSLKRTLWLFYDDIKLTGLRAVSKCDGLTLAPLFNYDFDAIRYDKFLYYDLSIDEVSEYQEIGAGYFKTVNWFNLQNAPVEVFGIVPPRITPPPYKPFGYKVVVETLSGKKFEAATEELEPIATKAKMKIEINRDLDGGAERWEEGGESPKGEAPFYMRMSSEAENATQLHFSVRNDLRAVRRGRVDTLFYEKIAASSEAEVRPSAELFTAGVYRAELRTVNEVSGCQDTFRIQVKVDSALLSKNAIPNVFSPNGDGINDLFQIIERDKNAKSLKEFDVVIMNRNGIQVYEYHGDIRKWDGWNGRKDGKGNPLPVGVYFYIVRAVGWDGVEFSGKEYKGVLHLYR